MEKDYISLRANAKINLALQVVGKRDDGYHDLRMIMQTLLLYDSIFIRKIDSTKRITMKTNVPWLPTDGRNLVYRAIDLIQKNYNTPGSIYAEIEKNIPVSAGLGGGSADCAAALIGMRRLYNINLSMTELRQIGKELGADIPYLLTQGTALVQGIGDDITRISPHPFIHVLLAKPKFNVSTKIVFSKVDISKIANNGYKIDKIIRAIENKNLNQVGRNLFNDLERVTSERHPIILDIKKVMLEHGAIGAIMSGSGPTVFGYYRTQKHAINAAKYLRSQGIRDLYLTGIFNRKPKHMQLVTKP